MVREEGHLDHPFHYVDASRFRCAEEYLYHYAARSLILTEQSHYERLHPLRQVKGPNFWCRNSRGLKWTQRKLRE
ncbi:hypothetical protein GCM10028774_15570 [Spirosoma jeollabukense]